MRKILLLCILLLIAGCQVVNKTGEPKNDMDYGINSTSAKTILMVIAPRDFRDAEFNEPKKVFAANGFEIKVASIQKGVSVGAEGTEVNIDLTVSEVKVAEYDAAAFIGGPGMAQIINDESLGILAKKFYDAGKITAAICVAPAILAKAQILKGKRATSWSGSQDDLADGGATYTGEAVTVDGKIITGSGPEAAQEFGEKIVEALR